MSHAFSSDTVSAKSCDLVKGLWFSMNECCLAVKVLLFDLFLRYTSKKQTSGNLDVYAIVLDWPNPGDFYLDCPKVSPAQQVKVTLLGYDQTISWVSEQPKGITLNIPAIPFNKMPCSYAWVFKMENLMV